MTNYQPIIYPPLGSVTVIRNNQNFSVRAYLPSKQGVCTTVELWTCLDVKEWRGICMEKVILQEEEIVSGYEVFEVVMEESSFTTLEYTVRFKTNAEEDWSWIGQKEENSKVHVSAESVLEEFEVDGLLEMEQLANWKFNKLRKNVWSLEVEAKYSNEIQSFSLGNIKTLVQWVALKRRGLYWLEPLTGLKNINFFDSDVQYLLWQRRDGSFGVLIPVADESCSAALRTNKEGKIELSVINDSKESAEARLLLCSGIDPFEITKNCMKGAKTILNTVDETELDTCDWYDKLYHRLGYCTWNAYYTDISHEKLVELSSSLRNSKVPVSYLIIDDGWLNISSSAQLKTMSADPIKFPQGLKAVIKQIKKEYPSIQDVGVWHTLWGYWGGFSPDDEIGHAYKTVEVKLRNGGVVPLIHENDIERFFDDYHRYLRDQGVTLVKVDAQSSFDAISFQSNEEENPRTWWKAYQAALKKSTDRYFGGKVIYCMAQSPRLLFRQINRSEREDLAVFRNSDDYFPDAPREAQPWHIYTNTLNNLWISQFPIRPDWDMFQSCHPFAQFHSAARAMNAGPVYITDHIDRFELQVIKALVDDVDGRVLASKSPALPGRNEMFIDPTKRDFALKMWHVDEAIGVSTIGLFNCRSKVIVGTFRLLDIPGKYQEEGRYPYDCVLYLFKKKRAIKLSKGGLIKYIAIGLNEREFEIATYHQLFPFRSSGIHGTISCLGALGKYCGASAISKHRMGYDELTDKAPIYLVELCVKRGSIGFYIENLSKLQIKVWWNEKQVKNSKLEYDHINSVVIAHLGELKGDTIDAELASPSASTSAALEIWITTQQ
ncbi:hypothetical protein K7432_004411 [Basidiobolus ranarum]|uniref:Alpha-galactosidase n=1 Tax=Basidiobolus ranarum TaxID=34480 RepID=A0ABR2W5M0_9FUNG